MASWPVGVRFGGLGGQGLVTLGAVLAEAGARSGLRVAASQSYGSQARGGATRSDVILSQEEIDYPHVIQPDLLVVLAQEAYDFFAPGMAASGLILADDFFVKPNLELAVRQYNLPGTHTAIQGVGNKVAVNFVMFGALLGYTRLVDQVEAAEAIRSQVKERFQPANLKGFELGLRLGKALLESEGAWR